MRGASIVSTELKKINDFRGRRKLFIKKSILESHLEVYKYMIDGVLRYG